MEGQLEERDDPVDGKTQGNGDPGKKMVGAIEHAEPRLEDSVPQFDTVEGSYHFTLTGYSLSKGVGSGKYFSSGTFAVGGHDWAIYFYPDGKNDQGDHSDFVSVFIVLASDSINVQALFEITLLDRSGKGKHKIHSHFNGRIKSPYTLQCQGAMWGYKRYFRREALEKSVFLKDDTLEFKGRVGVLLSSIQPTKLVITPISPLPQPYGTPHQQSTGDDESSAPNSQEVGSQAEDGAENRLKGLRLQDQLARYHLKIIRSQSPITVSTNSVNETYPSTATEGKVG